MRRLTLTVLAFVLLAATAAACGNDSGLEEVGGDSAATTTTTTPPTEDAGSTDDVTPPTDPGAIAVTGTPLPVLAGGSDPAVGMAAPEVTGPGFDGSALTFANGQPRVIAFLAHWCSHCQAEVTNLMAWLGQGNALPEGVVVQSISTREDPAAPNYPPEQWLANEGWTYPVMVDDAELTLDTTFGLGGTPMWVGIDASGTVVGRYSGDQGPEAIVALMNATLG